MGLVAGCLRAANTTCANCDINPSAQPHFNSLVHSNLHPILHIHSIPQPKRQLHPDSYPIIDAYPGTLGHVQYPRPAVRSRTSSLFGRHMLLPAVALVSR